MSYEVYIDVRHHPKHSDDEQIEDTSFKLADFDGSPLHQVAGCLRLFADELDQRANEQAAGQANDARRAAARDAYEERQQRRSRPRR